MELLFGIAIIGALASGVGGIACALRGERNSRRESARVERLFQTLSTKFSKEREIAESQSKQFIEELAHIRELISQEHEDRCGAFLGCAEEVRTLFERTQDTLVKFSERLSTVEQNGTRLDELSASISTEIEKFRGQVEESFRILLKQYTEERLLAEKHLSEAISPFGVAITNLEEQLSNLESEISVVKKEAERLDRNCEDFTGEMKTAERVLASRVDHENARISSVLEGINSTIAVLKSNGSVLEVRTREENNLFRKDVEDRVSSLIDNINELSRRLTSVVERLPELDASVAVLKNEAFEMFSELGGRIGQTQNDSNILKETVARSERESVKERKRQARLRRLIPRLAHPIHCSHRSPACCSSGSEPAAASECKNKSGGSFLISRPEAAAIIGGSVVVTPVPNDPPPNQKSVVQEKLEEQVAEKEHESNIPNPPTGNRPEWEGEGTDPRRHGGGRPGMTWTVDEPCRKALIEIYCQKKGGAWSFFAEIPRVIYKKKPIVLMNGVPLPPCPDATFRVSSLFGTITCSWQGNGAIDSLTPRNLGDQGYLLFRIENQNGLRGRLAETYGEGTFLCVVPDDWSRADSVNVQGLPEKETIALKGYKGLLFSPSPENLIILKKPDGTLIQPSNTYQEFFLKGSESPFIHGFLDEPFFVGDLPRVMACNPESWRNVFRIVVRKEIEGMARPKEFIPLDEIGNEGYCPQNCADGIRVCLPQSAEGGSGGRFSVLLYERTGRPMQKGLVFSYHEGVRAIETEPYDPYDKTETRDKLEIKILHDQGCNPNPVDDETRKEASLIGIKGGTSVVVPISGKCEETRWVIRKGYGDEASFFMRIPSFSWSLCGEDGRPTEWMRSPIKVDLEDLDPLSGRILCVKAPKDAGKISATFKHGGRFEPQVLEQTEHGWMKGDLSKIGGFIYAQKSHLGTGRIPLILCYEGRKVDCFKIGHLDFKAPHTVGNLSFSRHQSNPPAKPKTSNRDPGGVFCVFCGNTIQEAELVAHVMKEHRDALLTRFFKQAGEEEKRHELENPPMKICRCAYCHFYVDLSNPKTARNAKEALEVHLKKEVEGGKKRRATITTVCSEEIRQVILGRLGESGFCKICGEGFTSRKGMLEHFFGRHRKQLIQKTEVKS